MARNVSYAQWVLEPYCIAAKLRALRMRKRLTLARLAIETGLSTALLSKLETNRMVPTLITLATICRVYGVGFGYFFSDPERHTMSVTRRAHLEGRGRGDDSPMRLPLNAPGENPRLVAEAIEIAAGTPFHPEEHGRQMCAFAYVLEGAVAIDSGGMTEMLEPGDCAYIESGLAFSWVVARGKQQCRLLLVRPAASTKSE